MNWGEKVEKMGENAKQQTQMGSELTSTWPDRKHILHQFTLQRRGQQAAWDRGREPADLGVCKDAPPLNTDLDMQSKELVTTQ